jgi:hypothetical protein
MLGVQSKPKTNVSSIRPAKPKPQGRDRLVHFDEQIGLAKQAIVELEQTIERFEGIIADAETNHRSLQAAIEADNGRALSDYSAGKVDADSSIARLVLLADNSKRAASAASAALPSANAQLENARAQLLELGEQRAAEMNRVLTMLGDFDAQEYQKAFDRLCRYHDRLAGFASVAQASHGDIQLIIDPLRTPRFAFPSMRGHIDSDPFLRHKPSDLTVAESAQKWTAVRERLSADASADVADLLAL